MLTKRVIPCFDVAEGRVVKGVQFLNLRDAGDPVELAQAYDAEGADELVFLDDKVSINTAAVENPDFVTEAAHRFGSQCIVVAIDAKRTGNGQWQVHTYGG